MIDGNPLPTCGDMQEPADSPYYYAFSTRILVQEGIILSFAP